MVIWTENKNPSKNIQDLLSLQAFENHTEHNKHTQIADVTINAIQQYKKKKRKRNLFSGFSVEKCVRRTRAM